MHQKFTALQTCARVAFLRFVRLCLPLLVLCAASVFLPTPVDASPAPTLPPPPPLPAASENAGWSEPNHPLDPLRAPYLLEPVWAAAARGSAGWGSSTAAPSLAAPNPPPSPCLVAPNPTTPPSPSPLPPGSAGSHAAPPPYWLPGGGAAAASRADTASASAASAGWGAEGLPAVGGWRCGAPGAWRPCHVLLVSVGLPDHAMPLARLAAELQSRVSIFCF